MVSFYAGTIFGMTFCAAVQLKYDFIFYFVLICTSVSGVFLLVKFPEIQMIISTSILGAYLAGRSFINIIDTIASTDFYPNEFTVAQKLSIGALDSIGWEFYTIILTFLVPMILIGIIFQKRK